jgi:hypothetical protein
MELDLEVSQLTQKLRTYGKILITPLLADDQLKQMQHQVCEGKGNSPSPGPALGK